MAINFIEIIVHNKIKINHHDSVNNHVKLRKKKTNSTQKAIYVSCQLVHAESYFHKTQTKVL